MTVAVEETKKALILEELDKITRRHRGILRAEDVVKFAENPDTTLHGEFEWDDDEAAHKYRVFQARNIIRVTVTVIEETDTEHKAYVSLPSDQKKRGGGYRPLVSVLSNADRRAELLEQAKNELAVFKKKYKDLTELSKVFDAISSL